MVQMIAIPNRQNRVQEPKYSPPGLLTQLHTLFLEYDNVGGCSWTRINEISSGDIYSSLRKERNTFLFHKILVILLTQRF